mmetsp:Transcript_9622/g.24742  ORF Transcript_9622/g.24742 Transcript_9622/m.24742 type:complete len:302 (-) Transcript_9622:8-913(-)
MACGLSITKAGRPASPPEVTATRAEQWDHRQGRQARLELRVGTLLQQLLDVGRDVRGEELLGEARDGLAVLVDQKLLKVPADVAPQHGAPGGLADDVVTAEPAAVIHRGWQGSLQELEQRNGIRAVHVGTREQVKLGLKPAAGADVLHHVQSLPVGVVLLLPELVAREAQHRQLLAKSLHKGIHLREIPCGRASEGRDVLDQDDLAGILAERDLLAGLGGGDGWRGGTVVKEAPTGTHESSRRPARGATDSRSGTARSSQWTRRYTSGQGFEGLRWLRVLSRAGSGEGRHVERWWSLRCWR